MSFEHCYECDAHTGRAGRGEDSLYAGSRGPYCEECYGELPEKLAEDRRFSSFWLTHKEPTKAADYILELEAKLADCGCVASDIGQSGHSCRSQGAGEMSRTYNPHREVLNDLYDLLKIDPEAAFNMAVEELLARLAKLEAKLAAAEARPAYSVAVEIGHLQCVRNNLQEALESTDVALNWINTMLDTTAAKDDI